MNVQALQLTRFFKAAPSQVFEAFTQPAALMQWFGPKGCTCPQVAVDLRVGGRWRAEMHGDDSGSVMIVGGEYREIVPPERLVFTWSWAQGEMAGVETVVSVTLRPKPGGTELTLNHADLPTAQAAEMHQRGWASTWDCLDDFIAGQPKTPVAQPVLLGSPASTYVRSARMVFEEKGVAYRLDPAGPSDAAVGEIHPFHKIPAYRQGPLRLFESSAIMRYADETLPGPKLQPEAPVERAQMEQWISAINSYMYDAMVKRYILQYVFPRGEGGQPDRAVIDKALPDIEYQLGLLDKAYGARDVLVGERLTLADLLLAPIVFYLGLFPESQALLAKFPNVARAQSVMAKRPSFAATMPPLPGR